MQSVAKKRQKNKLFSSSYCCLHIKKMRIFFYLKKNKALSKNKRIFAERIYKFKIINNYEQKNQFVCIGRCCCIDWM